MWGRATSIGLIAATLTASGCAAQQIIAAAAETPSPLLPSCDYGSPHPDAPPDLNSSHFWLGIIPSPAT